MSIILIQFSSCRLDFFTGGIIFATLSMVAVFLNLDGGVLFITFLLNLSMLIAFVSPDGGVVFTTLFYGEKMKKKNMV